MPRVKRGPIAHKKRERLLKLTKGYRWSRKSKERAAKEALLHALSRMRRGRKERKREFARLWNVKVNAAVRAASMSYSAFRAACRKKGVALNRKMLADLAEHHPQILKRVVEFVR
jgi:large subunit ribosomal protein L20